MGGDKGLVASLLEADNLVDDGGAINDIGEAKPGSSCEIPLVLGAFLDGEDDFVVFLCVNNAKGSLCISVVWDGAVILDGDDCLLCLTGDDGSSLVWAFLGDEDLVVILEVFLGVKSERGSLFKISEDLVVVVFFGTDLINGGGVVVLELCKLDLLERSLDVFPFVNKFIGSSLGSIRSS